MYFNILRYSISHTSICLFNALLEDNLAHVHAHTTIYVSVTAVSD